MARAEFGSNKLPVGWFAFCSFWHEVLIVALTAGWGRARDRAPGLECSSLLGNLFFLTLEACNTELQDGGEKVCPRPCCTAKGRMWQWRLIPPARDNHIWDNSQTALSHVGRLE